MRNFARPREGHVGVTAVTTPQLSSKFRMSRDKRRRSRSMKTLRTLTVIAGILAGSLGAQTALAAGPVKAGNVVLVHGAWADGSSWAQVIPKLQAGGLHVTAVQNPLTSLEDSVAATRRVLAQQD